MPTLTLEYADGSVTQEIIVSVRDDSEVVMVFNPGFRTIGEFNGIKLSAVNWRRLRSFVDLEHTENINEGPTDDNQKG